MGRSRLISPRSLGSSVGIRVHCTSVFRISSFSEKFSPHPSIHHLPLFQTTSFLIFFHDARPSNPLFPSPHRLCVRCCSPSSCSNRPHQFVPSFWTFYNLSLIPPPFSSRDALPCCSRRAYRRYDLCRSLSRSESPFCSFIFKASN